MHFYDYLLCQNIVKMVEKFGEKKVTARFTSTKLFPKEKRNNYETTKQAQISHNELRKQA
jgi:hypothetical protein